ncbi:thioredoxin reductase [Natrinema pellirubrum DSM 15624]|uniref:Thioredoxin reductase n=1 Tax=Natrinema pellirubrum (strain DSM 15624 / CIP 106293 / JCM 10476 / NCIMB 786 / 157) TaxID=797303 RepID=L0JJK6_NATP1|nr:NAD(P)/FAD-dependent oxidoreductase [Natrinema pellirubrum]AGB30767.1 thioredoxin reductase [Natrinema pellirubrum DSM 15624]ELY80847.1 thioredoxin reductase [Natrinema pellirubrum DSM 15624]
MSDPDGTTRDSIAADRRYDVAVVGGGPAGLTTALYAARLGHETAVFDRGGGRAAMMQETHNVIGTPESVSGNEFLSTAVDQLRSYGADYRREFVTGIERADDSFALETTEGPAAAERVVLATGFSDERPEPPLPRTGRGLHYCLHCDAYMFVDESVYVMGSGESAAHVAMIMLNFTDDVDLLLRGDEPTWSDETATLLEGHPVDIVHEDVTGVRNGDDGWLEALEFEDGSVREYRGGFAMYGSDYNNDLAASLGAAINDDGTVAVDDHGRTSVDGLYAVGDLTPGHNQIPVAMGQGAKAGLAIHKELRAFPKSLEELEAEGSVSASDVPAMPAALRTRASDHASTADD